MGEDTTTTVTTEEPPATFGELQADPPTSDPSPPPSPDELLAQERERAARLEGELNALRARPAEPPKQEPPITVESIETAYSRGDLTDTQRIQALVQIEARTLRERERAQEKHERAFKTADERLGQYLTSHPELRKADSPLMHQVNAQLRDLDDMGYDPKDIRTQLIAVERVLGPAEKPKAIDTRDFTRTRLPVGGSPMTTTTPEPAKPKTKGERIWERLAPDYQAWFLSQRGSKDAALKTLEYADETALARQGRFVK